MKKFFQRSAAAILLFFGFIVGFLPPMAVQAQQFSLLPQAAPGTDCKSTIDSFEATPDQASYIKGDRDNILGCGIQTGRISLFMVPYYISYIINFLLALSGLISVLFIVIGGYRYVVGGLIDEKEKGKNAIKNALMGMGLALLAWTIVTVIMSAVTG